MQITWKPNAKRPNYLVAYEGADYEFTSAGSYEVPDALAKSLLAKRPELFGVHDPGGNAKSVAQPENNRMFGKPKRNK